jgi:putative membrane protein
MSLLSEEDKQAVADAIRQAEGSTSGEIVFAVTDSSGRYLNSSFQGALIVMAAATAVFLTTPVVHSISAVLWTEIISFGLSYSLLTYLPWRRWFIPNGEMDLRVREAAFAEFYSSGLYRTRESNGVLIYLSLLEHRVVILGDRAIDEKMGNRWDEVRDTIIRGIRDGKAREGVCTAVAICGRALAEHFPRRPDDQNELSDRVIDRRQNPHDAD